MYCRSSWSRYAELCENIINHRSLNWLGSSGSNSHRSNRFKCWSNSLSKRITCSSTESILCKEIIDFIVIDRWSVCWLCHRCHARYTRYSWNSCYLWYNNWFGSGHRRTCHWLGCCGIWQSKLCHDIINGSRLWSLCLLCESIRIFTRIIGKGSSCQIYTLDRKLRQIIIEGESSKSWLRSWFFRGCNILLKLWHWCTVIGDRCRNRIYCRRSRSRFSL